MTSPQPGLVTQLTQKLPPQSALVVQGGQLPAQAGNAKRQSGSASARLQAKEGFDMQQMRPAEVDSVKVPSHCTAIG